jgi:hypothetical protein
MNISPESLIAIRKLRIEKKFVTLKFYPGAPDEDTRVRCEDSVNQFLDTVVALLERGASKEQILTRAKETLDLFSREDTEERERADDYVGVVMRSIGIDDWTDFI